MGKKIGFFFLVVFIFVLICFTLIYYFGGIREYRQATSAINNLGTNEIVKASQILRGIDGENEYRGTLGYVNSNGYGDVLVWGINGPKYFKGDEHTVYSFYNGCSGEILNAKPGDGAIEVNREVYTDVKEWRKRVKNGNFVVILLAGEGSGGTIGNLREIWAFDWWYFLPKDMEELCAR